MISTFGLLMSLNDPQWGNRGNDNNGGRRPNQGPPDLEELWRDFNRKLSGMFGKKGGGNNGGNDGGGRPPVEFSPKFLGGGISVLVALLALVWLASGLISACVMPAAQGLELLGRVGIAGSLAPLALYGSAALDAAFGIATLLAPGRRLWLAQIALVGFYTVVIGGYMPEFLTHPFGPLLKNLPILAILILLYAEEQPT